MNQKRRSALELGGTACLRCGAAMTAYPAFNDLRFMCINGHFFATIDLLMGSSEGLAKELAALLSSWEQKALNLSRIEADARGRGRLDVAEVFRRNIDPLQARIKRLRDDLENVRPNPPTSGGP